MVFVDNAKRPLEAADIRLKVAGFYATVVRSDPSRLEVRLDLSVLRHGGTVGRGDVLLEKSVSSSTQLAFGMPCRS